MARTGRYLIFVELNCENRILGFQFVFVYLLSAFEILKNAGKELCYCKILRIPLIAYCPNSSILNELYLPMDWLCHFIRYQKHKYLWPHHTKQRIKTIMQGMLAEKRTEESQDKDGRKTSQIYLVQ